jgi:hypothetical protein
MKRVACRLWPTGPVSAGAAAGDNERALALIDEGLAMADEGGQHFWDAIASAAKSCSSDHPTPRPPKKPTRRPSLWRSDRAREATRCLHLFRSPSSTNPPPAPTKPMRSSRPRLTGSRPRRKCLRSPRRKRRSKVWRTAAKGQSLRKIKRHRVDGGWARL